MDSEVELNEKYNILNAEKSSLDVEHDELKGSMEQLK